MCQVRPAHSPEHGHAHRRLRCVTRNDPDQRAQLSDEYAYYPKAWREPYQGRRRKVGLDLYQLLGIAKGDGARMNAQLRRNHLFFGAPVGRDPHAIENQLQTEREPVTAFARFVE